MQTKTNLRLGMKLYALDQKMEKDPEFRAKISELLFNDRTIFEDPLHSFTYKDNDYQE